MQTSEKGRAIDIDFGERKCDSKDRKIDILDVEDEVGIGLSLHEMGMTD